MLSSPDNPQVKFALKLKNKKDRLHHNMVLIEGNNLIEEAKRSNLIVQIFSCDPNKEGTLVTEQIIKKLSELEHHQAQVAIIKKPLPRALGQCVLVLEDIQDPGNLGTLIRTAKAFNFTDVVVQGVEIFSPKVIRATQGAIFTINLVQVSNLKAILQQAYFKIGAILDRTALPFDKLNLQQSKIMLILGNEGHGISQTILMSLNAKVYIPIAFESLNISVAGGILMQHYQPKK